MEHCGLAVTAGSGSRQTGPVEHAEIEQRETVVSHLSAPAFSNDSYPQGEK